MTMTGRTAEWLGLVMLLLVCTVIPAVADDLTIQSMNWTYNDENTTLKVCTDGDWLNKNNIKLTVNNSQLAGEEIDGTLDDNNETCALFEHADKLAPFAEMTTYELSSAGVILTSSGSVTFSLEGVTIDCDVAQFLRFKYSSNGSVDDLDCIFENEDSSVCDVIVIDDASPDTICFSDLDPTGLKVCVQRTLFDLAAKVGSFTAETLRYSTPSFTLLYNETSISLAELLIFNDSDSLWSGVSCAGDICAVPSLEPSTSLYTLCGVFTDEDGTVSNSGVNTFQDMNLKVVKATSAVDFYFINKKADKQYYVYSTTSSETLIDEFNLDCSHIDEDTICNGFFDADPSLAYVAVSYDSDGANKIIAPSPSLESPQSRNHRQ